MTATPSQIDALKAKLPDALVSVRDGRGGRVPYMEGNVATNQANEIFGFGEWSMTVTTPPQAVPCGQYVGNGGEAKARVLYWCAVQVVALGVTHEDVGSVAADDAANPDEIDKAIKGCVTDAMKRALRHFGEQFGNNLSKDGTGRRGEVAGTRAQNTQRPAGASKPGSPAPTAPPATNAPARPPVFKNKGEFLNACLRDFKMRSQAVYDVLGGAADLPADLTAAYETIKQHVTKAKAV